MMSKQISLEHRYDHPGLKKSSFHPKFALMLMESVRTSMKIFLRPVTPNLKVTFLKFTQREV